MSRRGLSQRSSRQKLLAPRAVAEVPVVLAILTLGIVSTSRRRPRSVSPEKEKLDDKAPNGNTRRVARRARIALLAAENELTRWSDDSRTGGKSCRGPGWTRSTPSTRT